MGGLIGILVGFAATFASSAVATTLGSTVGEWLGVGGSFGWTAIIRLVGAVVSLAIGAVGFRLLLGWFSPAYVPSHLAWVGAGLPWHVPATSVDRQCGSSQQAVHFVAQAVMAGSYDVAIACGVESMSRVPMGSNAKGGVGPFSQDWIAAVGGRSHPTQFEVSQVLAEKFGVTRDDMDAFSVESHRRAWENTENGWFTDELVPVPLKDEEGNLTGEGSTRVRGSGPGGRWGAWARCPAP